MSKRASAGLAIERPASRAYRTKVSTSAAFEPTLLPSGR
jgi:hypothetical protein